EIGIEPRHVLAEDLVGRVAERLPRAVVVEGDGALAVDRDHDVRGALEQLLEVDGRETGDGSHAGPRRAIVGGGGARVKAALALADPLAAVEGAAESVRVALRAERRGCG